MCALFSLRFDWLANRTARVKHGPQESVPEGMFDDSVNLVVWGHEHDCRIIPEPVAGKQYYITQPGSSVATSLADGESIEKYVSEQFVASTRTLISISHLQTCGSTHYPRQRIRLNADTTADRSTVRFGRYQSLRCP